MKKSLVFVLGFWHGASKILGISQGIGVPNETFQGGSRSPERPIMWLEGGTLRRGGGMQLEIEFSHTADESISCACEMEPQ